MTEKWEDEGGRIVPEGWEDAGWVGRETTWAAKPKWIAWVQYGALMTPNGVATLMLMTDADARYYAEMYPDDILMFGFPDKEEWHDADPE